MIRGRIRIVHARSLVGPVPLLVLWALMASGGFVLGADDAGLEVATREKLEHFEKRVRPVLVEHCYSCHSTKSDKLQAGLVLDSRAGVLRGGDSGPAATPGDASSSLLVEALRYDSYEMPPDGKLSDQVIADIERWIDEGAVWPEEDAPSIRLPERGVDVQARKAEHWVWQPMQDRPVPAVQDTSWPLDPLDHFILARLEAANLQPAAPVDAEGLLRRLCFDLTGLPPTPQQVAAFGNAPSQAALEHLVDELLESPHFGERWGRHWLDLVRYAESRGHEFDNDAPNAFQYRDYVIRALNADVSYDQFVREHIAGDLLLTPRLHPDLGFNESILGTGFWFLGEWVHSPVDIRKDETDRFDNMLDVMSKTFLGMTVSCARCHDHKFDAISSRDYYALSGFLQGSDYRQVRFESLVHNASVAERVNDLDAAFIGKINACLSDQGVHPPEPTPIRDALKEKVVFDYGAIDPVDFMQDGYTFGSGPRRPGQPYLQADGDQPELRFETQGVAASDWFWKGLESVSEKGVHNRGRLANLHRSGRTLRTPTFELTSGQLACRVQGAGFIVACVDSHRLIAGPLHGETVREIKSGESWVHLNLQRYVGHRIHLEFTPAKDAELAVALVVQDASQADLQELDAWYASQGERVSDFTRRAQRCVERDWLERWWKQRRALQNEVQRRSALAMAMWEGSGEDDPLLIRGSSANPGPIVPRRFLAAIAGEAPLEIAHGSGRLQLAEAIVDPENPLTYRVMVNRVWHHLMGRGIVPTTDDFGVLGQPPTHPQLLDHLAIRFVQQGGSLKQLLRCIVLSRTYQMSSHSDPDAVAADPNNLLWHHRPPKRLEGEVIRDALLAISGRLDRSLFGEPIPIHLTSFMDGRGKPAKSGPLDGDCRRSLYIAVRRNFLSPFMLAFDMPVPFSTMGRRNTSNVPAQALILMNDPFVLEQAEAWAKRTMQGGSSAEERVTAMYREAFARDPNVRELENACRFVSEQPESLDRWRDLAHALINTKEFIFLR